MYVTTLPVYSELADGQAIPSEINAKLPTEGAIQSAGLVSNATLCFDISHALQ